MEYRKRKASIAESNGRITSGRSVVDEDILSSKVSPAPRLEVDDDLRELDVSLFLELGQDASSEEHLGVTNTVGGGVKVQGFQLQGSERRTR